MILAIISRVCNAGSIDFSEWSIFAPQDIPKQETKENNNNNCGIHLCVWEFISISGQYIPFKKSEMNLIRKWITTTLQEAKPFKDSTYSYNISKLGKPRQ